MKVSRDGKHLEIQHAQLSDTGSYHCVASNVAGVTELWYRLQVTGESVVSRNGCFPHSIYLMCMGPMWLYQPLGHIPRRCFSRAIVLCNSSHAIPVFIPMS